MNVKYPPSLNGRDVKSLLAFGEEHGVKLHVVSLEPRKRLMKVRSQEVTIWPVEDFLNSLWAGEFLELQ